MSSKNNYPSWADSNPEHSQIALLQRSIPAGILGGFLELELPFYFINDQMLAALGYQSRDEFIQEINGMLLNIVHPLDRERAVVDVTQQHLANQDSYSSSYRIRRKDNTYLWVKGIGNPFRTETDRLALIFVCIDITKQKELENHLELYRTALQEMRIDIYEYDFQNQTQICFHNTIAPSIFVPYLENVPQSVVDSGIIHPESIQNYLNLFEQIKDGASRVMADIRLCIPDCPDQLFWERITLNGLFDENGTPLRAILIGEDISQQKQAELNYQRDLRLRDSMTSGFIAGSRANLTKNLVEYAQPSTQSHTQLTSMTYDEMVVLGSSFISNLDDRERYFSVLSRDALLSAFHVGRISISIDYRRTDKHGEICWVRATAQLLRDVMNGDIYSYSTIRDINEQKIIELALQHRAVHDNLTGAYNKDTSISMIENAIAISKKKQTPYCLLLFRIDYFNYIIQNGGYKKADMIVCELNTLLHSELEEPKIIGRLFGDEMIVFLGSTCAETQIKRDIEKIQHLVATSALMPQVSFPVTLSICGIYCTSISPPLDELLSQLHNGILECQQQGGNRHLLSKSNPIPTVASTAKNEANTDDDISDFIMRCAYTLISAKNFSTAATVILRNLCHYFQASYGGILELDSTKEQIQHIHTWSDAPKLSTIDFKNSHTFASLKMLLEESSTLFVEQVKDLSDCDLRDILNANSIQNIYVLSLDVESTTFGYLVITNITNNLSYISLFDFLRRILANDLYKRFLKQENTYFQHHDPLTGLHNRRNYLRYVAEYQSDSAISLGIVVVDINGLKQINTEHGYANGDALVLFVAEKLKEVLVNAHIFRLSGDEFLAACENLTGSTFHRLVCDYQALVEHSYPESISIGYTWGDTDIEIDKLITLADEKLQIRKHHFYRKESTKNNHVFLYDTNKLQLEIELRQYEMYLQPKALIATSEIAGAEALVRYRDSKGVYIPPSRFVPYLEQNGNIHFIDLFMFEEVCRILKEWQDKKYPLIPISLNFSRTTLLTEHLIIKMEAIYERYQVPKEFIEIEVTESIGSVERQTLLDICSQIVNYDYRLSLDDFGAKYSNLSILSAMKLHVLKLDKSLVNDIFSNPNTRIVVRNFLLTCKELSISSVAEGVETKEQLEVLKELDCDYAQGYYFNKPIPVVDFERLYIKPF